MTQPPFSGAPVPVSGVTGGPAVLGGQVSNDPSSGNVVISPNPGNALQIRKSSTPQAFQVYEYFNSNTDYSRISLNTQSGGPFQLAVETAPGSVIRDLQLIATGNILIPTASLNFSGSGQRFQADFFSGPVINRFHFQERTSNNSTNVGFIPNGTADTAQVILNGASDPGQAPRLRLSSSLSAGAQIVSDQTGGATAPILTIVVAGSERMRFSNTSQSIGFYGSAGSAKPTITGAKGSNAALGSLLTALANMGLVTDSTSA